MAALDYAGSSDLMNDMTFRGRVKVAALHFAGYVLGEDPGVPAHNTRVKWSQATLINPDFAAAQIAPVVVGDPNVQSQGAAIPDDQLQSAVEEAVGKLL
jgi:hypothetical protein